MDRNVAIQLKSKPDNCELFCISQGFKIGNLIILSGQGPVDHEGNIVAAGDFTAQADQTVKNIEAILNQAGSSLSKVIKVTIYATDLRTHFPDILALRKKWFTSPYPADTTVEITALALPEMMIEIDVIALSEEGVIESGTSEL